MTEEETLSLSFVSLLEVKEIVSRRFRMEPGWLLRYARGFHPWSSCHLIAVWSGFSLRFHVATGRGVQPLQQTRGLEDKNNLHVLKHLNVGTGWFQRNARGSCALGVEHLIVVWLVSFIGFHCHRSGCIASCREHPPNRIKMQVK